MLKSSLSGNALSLAAGALTVSVFATGCFSVSSYHTARPVQAGTTEIMVAVSGFGTLESDGSGVSYSSPRLNVRRGISSDSDFGLTAGEFGLGFDYNHLLINSRTFALSFDPYIGILTQGVFGGDTNRAAADRSNTALTVYMGLLADVVSSNAATVTLGAKLGALANLNDGGDTTGFTAGSIGIKFNADTISIMPELTMIFPLEDKSGNIWTAGVGIGF